MTVDLLTKSPPHSKEAECATLGSILIWPDVFDDVAELVAPNEFRIYAHELIFRSMLRVKGRGVPPDAILVADDLEAKGELEEVGGVGYLITLSESVPHAAHARYYARVIKQKAKLRNLIYCLTEGLRVAYESPADDDVDDLVNRVGEQVTGLIEDRSKGVVSFNDGTLSFLESLESKTDNLRTVATGYPDLDRKLKGGLRPRQYVIIAAPTSIGKTALAGNIVVNVAKSVHCLVFSLEMGSGDLFARYIPAIVRIPLDEMRSSIEAGTTEEVSSRIHDMATRQLDIDDGCRTLAAIQARTRQMVKTKGTKVVILDYLQQVEGDRRLPRQEQVAAVSRALQTMAAELDITVIALSQVRRGAGENGERLCLRDLKESGSLENDADLVLLLNRERDSTNAILDIAKHRAGEIGPIELSWNSDLCRYESVAQKWIPSDQYDPDA